MASGGLYSSIYSKSSKSSLIQKAQPKSSLSTTILSTQPYPILVLQILWYTTKKV